MVTEQYQIEDSPWTDTKTQGVNFNDYKARIKAQHDSQKQSEQKERDRLGDLVKEKDQIEELDTATEEERDRILYEDYLKKGLVNIKNLVLKNPALRTPKESEFLILYMKHQFEVFYEIDKDCIEMFVQRLSFDVYKPGDVVAQEGQVCAKLIMFIDGEIEAVKKLQPKGEEVKSGPREDYIKTFKPGQCLGDEGLTTDNYRL